MIRGVLAHPPRFLTRDEVLTIQETAIDQHGGAHGVRDGGLLDSALAMPRQQFGGEFAHEIPFQMGAAYGFHICKNHPFVDGNKRAAFGSTVVFLRMNGWVLIAAEIEAADVILSVAEGAMSKEDLAAWLGANTRPRSSLELREFFGTLEYGALAETFEGITAGAHEERFTTIMEAGRVIPAIHSANMGATSAESGGDAQSAFVLRQHSMLLTAIYRIAEDMGYEW